MFHRITESFICMTCNKEMEKSRPWLFERRYTPKTLHDQELPEGNGKDGTVVRVGGQSTKQEDGGSNGSPKGGDNSEDVEGASGTPKREMRIEHATPIAVSPPEHHWSHGLVLCHPTVPMTAAAMTVEERLVKLETTPTGESGDTSLGGRKKHVTCYLVKSVSVRLLCPH